MTPVAALQDTFIPLTLCLLLLSFCAVPSGLQAPSPFSVPDQVGLSECCLMAWAVPCGGCAALADGF